MQHQQFDQVDVARHCGDVDGRLLVRVDVIHNDHVCQRQRRFVEDRLHAPVVPASDRGLQCGLPE